MVSQHAEAAATYREWIRTDKEHWIIPRDQAAYDVFVTGIICVPVRLADGTVANPG